MCRVVFYLHSVHINKKQNSKVHEQNILFKQIEISAPETCVIKAHWKHEFHLCESQIHNNLIISITCLNKWKIVL